MDSGYGGGGGGGGGLGIGFLAFTYARGLKWRAFSNTHTTPAPQAWIGTPKYKIRQQGDDPHPLITDQKTEIPLLRKTTRLSPCPKRVWLAKIIVCMCVCVCVCVCLSTFILKLQAVKWLLSNTNCFNTSRT